VSSELIRKSVQQMTGYVPGEQPQGQTIIKLNTNENPYPPSPRVVETLHQLDPDVFRKYPNPVADDLRSRIAELHGCSVENVFVGNGSDEALALCTRAFVENDGNIGYFEPSYSLYPILADIRDVRKSPVDLDETFGWVTPPVDLCPLFFLTNPNAPTSMRFSRSDVESFCSLFRGVVLIDEAYVDFADEHCMDLALTYENVLVLRTLSKSFSLAGVRVGYVVGAAALITAMMKLKDSYNLDCIAQELALAALNDMDYMQSNAKRIITSREKLTEDLSDVGFEVCCSQTNFLWTKPPAVISASDLFVKLRDCGILVRYFPGPKTGDYIRITIGTEKEVAVLLDAVHHIVKDGIA
jgi:histidinol-phosphate aminotransferase